ncbi:hypothetical protein CesoFtcFv8_004702 [Champsocephalus esox]|uniref:Uncharacterized protein n=1 Tax=Champsocephalus esox TaxID=159716 RepID=A0AAN8CMX9_9TELE|nr:hypothetical protein CesoFtcFv8_004702 [Champsocephalus esox]
MSATGLIPAQTGTSWMCASLSSSSAEYPSSKSSPVHCNGAESRDTVDYAARCVAVLSMEQGAEEGLGEAGKPRPPSVALCAAIGELSKGDCTTDGHLQSTMIPFVQPLPTPLNIKLVMIQSFTSTFDTG